MMDDFTHGVLLSVSVLMACHDAPVEAATILKEMGMATADCSELDAYDKRNLRKVQGEIGGMIRLKGLRTKRPNVEFSGGAPLHGAASAGTKG